MNQANISSRNTNDNTIGVLDITGGTFSSADNFVIGTGINSGRGVVSVYGGTLSPATSSQSISLIANGANAPGSGVTGILNVGGGPGAAQVLGASTTTASRGLVYATVNLTNSLAEANLLPNGTLSLSGITATYGSPSNYFDFNGGTLEATPLNVGANFLNSANISGVYVYGGGGTINNNGTAITIANALLAPPGNGVNSIASFSGGAGDIGAPYVAITRGAGDTTGWGATAVAQIDSSAGNATSGQVTNVLITSPGLNYTATPNFVLIGGGASTPATITGAAPTPNSSGGLVFAGAARPR